MTWRIVYLLLIYSLLITSCAKKPITISSQTTESAMANHDLEYLSTLPILKQITLKHEICENVEAEVYNFGNEIVISLGEINSVETIFNEEEVISLCKEWMDSTYKTISASDLDGKKVSVHPIVTAEVNMDGGEEIESIIGCTVTFENDFQGVRIMRDGYIVTLDYEGVKDAALYWNDYEAVKQDTAASDFKVISYEQAVDIAIEYIKTAMAQMDQPEPDSVEYTMKSYELVYAYEKESDTYQPTWLLNMVHSTYMVNIFNGEVTWK